MSNELPSEVEWFRVGVAFWRSRGWPADFHNADCEKWDGWNPDGNFTIDWWRDYQLPELRKWIATRPYSGSVLTQRFEECRIELSAVWHQMCAPRQQNDITDVQWREIAAFPEVAAYIKPTKSPVFASKFCHFLLPKVFPVVDSLGLGEGWTYARYFETVQDEWDSFDAETKTLLIEEMTRLVTAQGAPVYLGFPMTNKVVELTLIGRLRMTGRVARG